ncbi:hypothetical protein MPSEU_000282900 [Mayamaea pseudoterrestris]|nr:hypothetical protein MPSEU_000282900 [Mayamaea pseudoterrestris]
MMTRSMQNMTILLSLLSVLFYPRRVVSLAVALPGDLGGKSFRRNAIIPPQHLSNIPNSCQAPALSAKTVSYNSNSDETSVSWFDRFFGRKSVVDPYHLLWSPGFLKKMATAATLLYSARIASTKWQTRSTMASKACTSMPHVGIWQNVGLPLLASACCLLQLGLNVLSIGCAGFNTYLGPLRPYFMAILIVLSMQSAVATSTLWTARGLLTMVTRWSVALLPEGLYLFNKYANEGKSHARDESLLNTMVADVELHVPTMGCVACINSIDTALKRQAGVRHASASLYMDKKGGKAAVQVEGVSENELKERIDDLCNVVGKAGFGGCVVKAVETKT